MFKNWHMPKYNHRLSKTTAAFVYSYSLYGCRKR